MSASAKNDKIVAKDGKSPVVTPKYLFSNKDKLLLTRPSLFRIINNF